MTFLDLPGEIRNNIYTLLLSTAANRTGDDKSATYDYSPAIPLFGICKQIRQESLAIFHALNQFILIDTPWEDAESHVAFHGNVPVVVPGRRAALFTQWTLAVSIFAPESPFYRHHEEHRKFILHVDDLPAFCQTWKYSDLTTPGLNEHLAISLELRDPLARDGVESRLAKETQRRLLLPLQEVKRLREVEFKGDLKADEGVKEELLAAMKTPHDDPAKCLEVATEYRKAGNKDLQEKRYTEAEEWYRKAWLAIHIVVEGKKRQVHADQWFYRARLEQEYMTMRVKLVANTVQLYLLMQRYEDACFWGMRTINTVRVAIGLNQGEPAGRPEDEIVRNFMSDDMGKIYFRTAMAWKALEDMFEARALLKVAVLYLPNDRRVREEAAAAIPRMM